ncbi:hypothetical protein [Paenibacillus alkalitolerans]|uniref:hypothetical protein n=1 Tax=Paenibacillus alkalitolerans TaxID=2799335 RepID=UPI0018F7425A|nr:hypothetical protein [Paenibacillus alkalitolerans]
MANARKKRKSLRRNRKAVKRRIRRIRGSHRSKSRRIVSSRRVRRLSRSRRRLKRRRMRLRRLRRKRTPIVARSSAPQFVPSSAYDWLFHGPSADAGLMLDAHVWRRLRMVLPPRYAIPDKDFIRMVRSRAGLAGG